MEMQVALKVTDPIPENDVKQPRRDDQQQPIEASMFHGAMGSKASAHVTWLSFFRPSDLSVWAEEKGSDMKGKRYMTEDKIRLLREADRGEKSVAELCREVNVSEVAFHRWKRQFGHMGVTPNSWQRARTTRRPEST